VKNGTDDIVFVRRVVPGAADAATASRCAARRSADRCHRPGKKRFWQNWKATTQPSNCPPPGEAQEEITVKPADDTQMNLL